VYGSPEIIGLDGHQTDKGLDAIDWSCESKVYRYAGIRQDLVVDAGQDAITGFMIELNGKRLLIGLSGFDKDDIYQSSRHSNLCHCSRGDKRDYGRHRIPAVIASTSA
jgi:hypothetical protein